MKNDSFLASPSGRLLLATAGVNALAIGLLGLIGPSSAHLPILAIVPLASIVACIFVVGFIIEREHAPVLFLELALPFIAGIAYAALFVAPKTGASIATSFVLAGALATAMALVRPFTRRDPRPSVPTHAASPKGSSAC